MGLPNVRPRRGITGVRGGDEERLELISMYLGVYCFRKWKEQLTRLYSGIVAHVVYPSISEARRSLVVHGKFFEWKAGKYN